MKHSPRFLKLVKDCKKKIVETGVKQVKSWIDNDESFVLIDVRERKEWDQGHLPTAIYLGKGILERDIEIEIPEINKKIVLYCGGGFRSALAAENLQKMGYESVLSMDGGFKAWKDAGYEIV